MKSIYTLKQDIYDVVSSKGGWASEELAQSLGLDIARRAFNSLEDQRTNPRLRMSMLGPRCPRALWYSIHKPELAEPLPPWAKIKYTYGHAIEALAIAMSKAAGHHVCGEQDELRLDGILGHRDCVIDGCVTDVKSVTSIGFDKYQFGTLAEDDPFGYLDQLDAYILASADDPLVTERNKGFILAIDKNLGKIALYEHRLREHSVRDRIERYKKIIALDKPPACTCGTVPEGKSGNVRLDTRASYSDFKWECFPRLRCFLYASGPVYLSEVKKRPQPHIVEVDRHGQTVYT